jgi:hypothetical protein
VTATRPPVGRALISNAILPNREEPPILRVTLEGVLSAMEGATLDWLSHRSFPRATLKELLLAIAQHAILAAASIDPTFRLDPEILATPAPRADTHPPRA